MATKYVVKTGVFEGPLDLLLDLVEKRKLFIGDISLAKVADDYMEFVKDFSEFPTRDAASFLFVASTIVLIKSKLLLPSLKLTEEEEGDIRDLERRLKLYKRIKGFGKYVKERFGINIIFPRNSAREVESVFSPHESITTTSLHIAMKDMIERLPKKQTLTETIVQKVISLEEMIENLTDRIRDNMAVSFSDFANGGKGSKSTPKEEKLNLIVSFLAMLELVKQGSLAVQQEGMFNEITMENNSES